MELYKKCLIFYTKYNYYFVKKHVIYLPTQPFSWVAGGAANNILSLVDIVVFF